MIHYRITQCSRYLGALSSGDDEDGEDAEDGEDDEDGEDGEDDEDDASPFLGRQPRVVTLSLRPLTPNP